MCRDVAKVVFPLPPSKCVAVRVVLHLRSIGPAAQPTTTTSIDLATEHSNERGLRF